MARETQSANEARMATLRALRDAFRRDRPDIEIDDGGYIASFHDNLLPGVLVDDFVADLQSGDVAPISTCWKRVRSRAFNLNESVRRDCVGAARPTWTCCFAGIPALSASSPS